MFRIASFQFGYAMYAASIAGGVTVPQWSDRVDEAHVYDHRDNRELKLRYWRAYAEVQGLDPEQVRIVEAA